MLKYQQIAADIEQEIVDKDLQQGDKLPVLDAFMAQFDVSKSTITKALDLLEKKGIVYQVRGSGIFVRRHKRRGYISLLSNQGFKKELDGFQITSEVLALDIRRPTAEAARNLAVDPEESVYYVKRVRYINGQTLCIEESYYNKSVVSYLNNEIVSESIFNYISDALGLNIGFSDLYFNVGKIDKNEAELLRLPDGSPGLFMEQIFHLTNGQPFDFSKITYNYEQSQFFIQANNYFL